MGPVAQALVVVVFLTALCAAPGVCSIIFANLFTFVCLRNRKIEIKGKPTLDVHNSSSFISLSLFPCLSCSRKTRPFLVDVVFSLSDELLLPLSLFPRALSSDGSSVSTILNRLRLPLSCFPFSLYLLLSLLPSLSLSLSLSSSAREMPCAPQKRKQEGSCEPRFKYFKYEYHDPHI